MNSDRYFRARRTLVLVLMLGLAVGCGDDGGPTENGGTVSGPLGEFSATLGAVAEKYFENNEPAFSSLQTFFPFIQTALNVAPGGMGPAMGASLLQLQGCIDPAAFGTTFEYDFGQDVYLAGQMTGAPTDGVRFLLYEGQQANGHLDIRCPGDLPTISVSLTIVWDGATVYSQTTTGNINLTSFAWSINSTGTLHDPLSGDVLNVEPGGTGTGTQVRSSGFDFTVPAEDFSLSFGRLDDQSGVFVSGFALKGLSQSTYEWTVNLNYSGSSAQSLSGHVELHSLEAGSYVVACLSGSFAAPTVSEASGCADDVGFPVLSGVTSAHRSALGAAYASLYMMWETFTEIMQTGVELAISSAG